MQVTGVKSSFAGRHPRLHFRFCRRVGHVGVQGTRRVALDDAKIVHLVGDRHRVIDHPLSLPGGLEQIHSFY